MWHKFIQPHSTIGRDTNNNNNNNKKKKRKKEKRVKHFTIHTHTHTLQVKLNLVEIICLDIFSFMCFKNKKNIHIWDKHIVRKIAWCEQEIDVFYVHLKMLLKVVKILSPTQEMKEIIYEFICS